MRKGHEVAHDRNQCHVLSVIFKATLHLAGCVMEWGRKDWHLTVVKNDKLSPRKATPVQGQWEVAELDLINGNNDKES